MHAHKISARVRARDCSQHGPKTKPFVCKSAACFRNSVANGRHEWRNCARRAFSVAPNARSRCHLHIQYRPYRVAACGALISLLCSLHRKFTPSREYASTHTPNENRNRTQSTSPAATTTTRSQKQSDTQDSRLDTTASSRHADVTLAREYEHNRVHITIAHRPTPACIANPVKMKQSKQLCGARSAHIRLCSAQFSP